MEKGVNYYDSDLLNATLRLANHALTGGWKLQPCTDQLFADQPNPPLARSCGVNNR